MHRRRLLQLAAVGAAGLAGCTTGSDAPAAADDPGTSTDSPSSSATRSPTDSPTATESPTATPEFLPGVYFETCSEVRVEAQRYDSVTLAFENDLQQFDNDGEGYRGAENFAGTGDLEGKVVWEATVSRRQQTYERTNPNLDSCTATPTPEAPTESPTPHEYGKPRRDIEVVTDVNDDSWDYYLDVEMTNHNEHVLTYVAEAVFYDAYDEYVGRDDEDDRDFDSGETHRFRLAYDGDMRVDHHELTIHAKYK